MGDGPCFPLFQPLVAAALGWPVRRGELGRPRKRSGSEPPVRQRTAMLLSRQISCSATPVGALAAAL